MYGSASSGWGSGSAYSRSGFHKGSRIGSPFSAASLIFLLQPDRWIEARQNGGQIISSDNNYDGIIDYTLV